MNTFSLNNRLGNLNINREGNKIHIGSPPNGLRQPDNTSLEIELNDDKVTIRGRKDKESCAYDITMTPDLISVSTPTRPGVRELGKGYSFTPSQPLDPKNYGKIGLDVASSVVGLPLSLLAE